MSLAGSECAVTPPGEQKEYSELVTCAVMAAEVEQGMSRAYTGMVHSCSEQA